MQKLLAVISPAKSLKYEGVDYPDYTQPAMLEEAEQLVDTLKDYSAGQLSKLMSISDNLGELNQQRYEAFTTPFTAENAKQALLVFQGDVYKGIAAENYKAADLKFAQNHLRILSGLYGVLKPLDLMQPYRLEMGTKLESSHGKNLYEFWGTKISEAIDAEKADYLINLASNEYFKAVDKKSLKTPILDIAFKEKKETGYKVIGIHAKRTRGLMVDYIIRNRVKDVAALKDFDTEGYTFSKSLSSEKEWVFMRG